MISDKLVAVFTNAARALVSGVLDTGITSQGTRKLDFKSPGGKIYTAIIQNPEKLSTPAKLKRAGHDIVQIRDNQSGTLLGFVNLTDNTFNSFEAIPTVMDYSEVEKSLAESKNTIAKPGDVKVSAAASQSSLRKVS